MSAPGRERGSYLAYRLIVTIARAHEHFLRRRRRGAPAFILTSVDPTRSKPSSRLLQTGARSDQPRTLRACRGRAMRVTVLFFASARELAGASECVVELEEGARTVALRAAVAKRFPLAKELVADVTLALNEDYVEIDADPELKDGDTVALIPPVSGG